MKKLRLDPKAHMHVQKAYAFHLIRYYRDAFGIYASTSIFYNHESPRRTDEYVTRKITKAVARISKGLQDKLFLGDISIKIDFGYAKNMLKQHGISCNWKSQMIS